MTQQLKKLLPIGIALELIVLALAYVESNGDTTHFFQAAARLSGRVSLLYFLIFGIFAIRHPSVEGLVLNVKKVLVRDFAIIHVIHWCFLAVAVYLSGFELVPYRVAGGTLAYGLIVAMPFILEGKILANGSLSRLQMIYILYVWLIFFMTYLPRIMGKVPTATGSMTAYYLLIGVCVAFLLAYLSSFFKQKSKFEA